MSARTIAASPSSGCVMAAMTAGTARTRPLTVVRGAWGLAGEVAPGRDGPPTHPTSDSTAVGMSPQLPGPAPSALASLSGSLFPPQKARRAAPAPSPARAPTCASPSAGSVTVTRTALTALTRASQPAAVSGGAVVSLCRRGDRGPGEEVFPRGVTQAVSGRALSTAPSSALPIPPLRPQEGRGETVSSRAGGG